MQRSAKGYLRPYNRGDIYDKGRDLCDVQMPFPLIYLDRGRRLKIAAAAEAVEAEAEVAEAAALKAEDPLLLRLL
ncbi:hypothetical protein L249_8389 [Ophiocordyceps polyrhachis-furcata BCC 54312]|uniref:Uncharacterized protein n=1 Tax=Ophiocordyceps polyrhachis-furcata BCC 54312 TaxID=1330021 RepID=A0A367L6V2_9HYPO|nr:hypothetical protein L249_8389 [Ophiocordyceps polyrhachis-furcata BCC 54312]